MTNQDLFETEVNSVSTLTPTNATSDQQTKHLVWAIAQGADDRKAADITILKVNEISYLSDYFVIVTGFSRPQVKAISEAIEAKVAQECEQLPLRIEGKADASWIVQDYGDVIVHIFLQQEREFYRLEAFWGHAQRLEFSQLNSVPSSGL